MTNYTKTRKTKSNWTPLWMALAVVFGMLLGLRLDDNATDLTVINYEGEPSEIVIGKVEELVRYVDAKYVDEKDREGMIDQAIQSILDSLDPHSSYIDRFQVAELQNKLEGHYRGIGIEYLILDDTLCVLKVLEDSPAQRAQIKPGDRILSVEDSLIAGKGAEIESIIGYFKEQEAKGMRIEAWNPDTDQQRALFVEWGKIETPSLDLVTMIKDDIGYIKVNFFGNQTYQEFMEGVERLSGEGMQNLIIDLRQNPGGLLRESTKLLNQLFWSEGQLLVYTEGRNVKKREYRSNGRHHFDIDDIVVLIDEGSASASEIIAGALQDNDRGVIIGNRSYGKGLVQEQYPLSDGSAIRLTVAKYYTPSGRSIQREYASTEQYYNPDSIEQFRNDRSEKEADALNASDMVTYYTNNGRTVFGGGGITPDILIEKTRLDSLKCTNLFNDFVFSFMLRNKISADSILAVEEGAMGITDLPWMNEFILASKEKGFLEESATSALAENYVRYLNMLYLEYNDRQEIASMIRMNSDACVLEAIKVLGDEGLQSAIVNPR